MKTIKEKYLNIYNANYNGDPSYAFLNKDKLFFTCTLTFFDPNYISDSFLAGIKTYNLKKNKYRKNFIKNKRYKLNYNYYNYKNK